MSVKSINLGLHLNPVRPTRRTALTAAAGITALAAGAWWFSDQAPYPYAQRRLLDIQLPFLAKTNLDAMLQARSGERILELGPGTGLQALHVAPQLGADGRLDIVDIQQEMLDHVMARAGREKLATIHPHRADARELPFADHTFDAVYLVTALGEIPEPQRALGAAARVLKPGGRLVVGEFFDRHWIPFSRLHRLADSSGLHLTDRHGTSFAYLAKFHPCGADTGFGHDD
jgi:ubiquinone/menaquinone biosynthesis C-methylase UbiE